MRQCRVFRSRNDGPQPCASLGRSRQARHFTFGLSQKPGVRPDGSDPSFTLVAMEYFMARIFHKSRRGNFRQWQAYSTDKKIAALTRGRNQGSEPMDFPRFYAGSHGISQIFTPKAELPGSDPEGPTPVLRPWVKQCSQLADKKIAARERLFLCMQKPGVRPDGCLVGRHG